MSQLKPWQATDEEQEEKIVLLLSSLLRRGWTEERLQRAIPDWLTRAARRAAK